MQRPGDSGYALLFTIGIVLVSSLIGLAYVKMGTLESALVTDTESWTQSLDSGEAAVQAVSEMVRSSRGAFAGPTTCRQEFNPFNPSDVDASNDPVWFEPCSAADYVDNRTTEAFEPGGVRQGIYRASVDDLQNIDRFDGADESEFPTAEYRTGKPATPTGSVMPSGSVINTKYFLSTVGAHPSADRPEQARRIATFAGLPGGLGRDVALVAGRQVTSGAGCLLSVRTPTFDPPPIALSGSISADIRATVYNGQNPNRISASGEVKFNGGTYDPPATPAEVSSCEAADTLLGDLIGGLPVTLPVGGRIVDLVGFILGRDRAVSQGQLPVLPPGLFVDDGAGGFDVNPWYFTGRSPADSPGIVEYAGDTVFRPGNLNGSGTYPGLAEGVVAIDGGDLTDTSYLRRGNVSLVHGDVDLLGGRQTIERGWSPVTDRNGIARPIDVVIAADGDIRVDANDERFRHVRTGPNTRLVLIAGRDIIFTGDLFLTDLNVVAVAGRDVVLTQRVVAGLPAPGSVLSRASVNVPNLAALPAMLSQLRGTLVAGRDIVTYPGWSVTFDQAVVNGNMSAPVLPPEPIADFEVDENGFVAEDNTPTPPELAQDAPLTPETDIDANAGALVIDVDAGDEVMGKGPLVLTATPFLTVPHPLTGSLMKAPVLRDLTGNFWIDYQAYGASRQMPVPADPDAPVLNPFTGQPLRKNDSQGERVVRSWLAPQDWSAFRTISFGYSSELPDQDVTNDQGIELPDPVATKLPSASLILEDSAGNRMVYPLPYTGPTIVPVVADLRADFLYELEVPVVGAMTPQQNPYGFSSFLLSSVSRIMVRINHAAADEKVRLSNIDLPGNAGAEHNLPFPFRHEFHNWQVMAAN